MKYKQANESNRADEPEIDASTTASDISSVSSPEITQPPGTPNDIPGLGPIRIRALQKAGLGSLAMLRSTTVERLCEVPGMSEIKARHIQSYLAQFSLETLEAQDSLAQDSLTKNSALGSDTSDSTISNIRSPRRAGLTVDKTGIDVSESEAALPITPLSLSGRNAMDLALRLVKSPPAPEYRARLLREIVRFMGCVDRVVTMTDSLTEKRRERALRWLNRAIDTFKEATLQPELDRKAQTRLADFLAEACDRLDAGSVNKRSPDDSDSEEHNKGRKNEAHTETNSEAHYEVDHKAQHREEAQHREDSEVEEDDD